MPRGPENYVQQAEQSSVKPLLFLRVLDIPKRGSPSEKLSLYFASLKPQDGTTTLSFFDEEDQPCNYDCVGFSFSQSERSTDNSIDSCTVSIDNTNMYWAQIASQYSLNGCRVDVLRGFQDALDTPDGAQLIFRGHIVSCVISESQIEASVTTDFSLKTRVPRRLYWPSDFPYLPSAKSTTSPLIQG